MFAHDGYLFIQLLNGSNSVGQLSSHKNQNHAAEIYWCFFRNVGSVLTSL